MNSQRLCDAGWQIMAGWCEPYAIRHDITWYFARVVFILLYYVLSSIRLYLCFVLCENIYIYNYIFIYLFIDLFHLFVFFYLFTCCIVLFFIYYICIYIERERERSYTTWEIKPYLLLPGCKWLRRQIGPSEASSGRLRVSWVRLSSGASEWENDSGRLNCPSKGWCHIKNDGISMEYIYISIYLSIYLSIHPYRYVI